MKIGGERNFGYGKKIKWAGKQALKERYVGDRFGSVGANSNRWNVACDWFCELGIRDALEIDLFCIVDYGLVLADWVANEEMEVTYAQNILSSINMVLTSMRRDKKLWVSPSALVGPRVNFRIEAPLYLHWDEVRALQHRLIDIGYPEVAALVGLARTIGLRFKECSLLDAISALSQANQNHEILVSRGTKGGHDRIVPVGESSIEALQFAASLQKDNCLIPSDISYVQWRNRSYHRFYLAGGKKFHDLRAAAGCDLYRAITGYLAPVLRQDGDPAPSREFDKEARLNISEQFGHHRIDVVSAYIGPMLRKHLKKS